MTEDTDTDARTALTSRPAASAQVAGAGPAQIQRDVTLRAESGAEKAAPILLSGIRPVGGPGSSSVT